MSEQAKGGEAFIPRYGNRDRVRQIVAAAREWYGGGSRDAQRG